MRVLEVENISFGYQKHSTISNISFNIDNKKVVGLVGPNGAGKTTIIKLICGILKPKSGRVKIMGLSIEDREEYLGSFSSIIETPSFYEDLSGFDNLEFVRKLNKITKENMTRVIEFVGIGKALNNAVSTYSLGMKQRLGLGIALLTEPKVLILDEPLNGLDYDGVKEFRTLLNDYVTRNDVCVLISSHNLAELDRICDSVIYVKEGQIVDVGKLDQSKTIKEVNLIIDDIDEFEKCIKELSDIIKYNRDGSSVNVSLEKSNVADFVNGLAARGISFSDIEIKSRTVESSYEASLGGGKDD